MTPSTILSSRQQYRSGPRAIAGSFLSHRALIASLIRRDIASRYRGSALGMAWAILNPLIMLLIYTFVFSQVFKMRWGGTATDPSEFALMLFAGMLVFNFFAECVNRAPGAVTATPNLVKKIVFPLETQAWVIAGSGLFQAAISLGILLLAHVVMKGVPPWTFVLIPLVFVPLVLLVLGVVWFLSALGVYLRDIGQLVGHLVMMTMFLSPLFYPVTAIPESFRSLFYLNPMTFLMGESRKVLILGTLPDWGMLGLFTLGGLLIASFGFWWFQRTRRGFADVL
ncbi:lipopolysaccharide transport system permease protein [Dyella sp. SG562]|uniref:ABC transporter permease n=1 Tax=Dyella TaxID=231454 RepID=UPI00141DE25C|nr:ABC transporter permease [Dyella sp. SG562]NII74716.1 lipopolysaccharide transport system permease protein [Dyella sp. SG562]